MAANAPEGLLSCAEHPTLCTAADFVGKYPAWGVAGALVIIAAFFYLGMRLSARDVRRDRARFARFIAALGGEADAGNALRGRAVVNGHEASIETWVPLNSTQGRVWTGYEMAIADPDFSLDIRPRAALALVGESLAFDDPDFDAVVWIATSSAERARLLLTPALRGGIAEVADLRRSARHPFAWHVHGGRLRFETPGAFDGAEFDARFLVALQVGAMMVTALQTA